MPASGGSCRRPIRVKLWALVLVVSTSVDGTSACPFKPPSSLSRCAQSQCALSSAALKLQPRYIAGTSALSQPLRSLIQQCSSSFSPSAMAIAGEWSEPVLQHEMSRRNEQESSTFPAPPDPAPVPCRLCRHTSPQCGSLRARHASHQDVLQRRPQPYTDLSEHHEAVPPARGSHPSAQAQAKLRERRSW